MNCKGATVAGAAIIGLALPATAGAHQEASPASVAKHVRNADGALAMVETLVSRNQDAQAAVQAARNHFQTQAAAREAGQLVRGAETRPERVAAAKASRLVASQLNENAETYAEVVDEVEPRFQDGFADLVESGLRGRELALAILTRLAEELPPQAQQGIATAIAALSSDGEDETEAITEALDSGQLTEEAEETLAGALQTATAAIDAGIARLSSLVDLVPEQARPRVQAAVEQVISQLKAVKERLAGLSVGPPTGTPGGPTAGLPISPSS